MLLEKLTMRPPSLIAPTGGEFATGDLREPELFGASR